MAGQKSLLHQPRADTLPLQRVRYAERCQRACGYVWIIYDPHAAEKDVSDGLIVLQGDQGDIGPERRLCTQPFDEVCFQITRAVGRAERLDNEGADGRVVFGAFSPNGNVTQTVPT